MTRPYEVMIVLEPTLEDDAVKALVARSTDQITAAGATVGRVDRWGKRRLAYEIRHHREGHYILIEALGEPAVMEDLSRSLYLIDEVIRHKVMRVPDSVAGRSRRPAPVPEAGDVAADGAAVTS